MARLRLNGGAIRSALEEPIAVKDTGREQNSRNALLVTIDEIAIAQAQSRIWRHEYLFVGRAHILLGPTLYNVLLH